MTSERKAAAAGAGRADEATGKAHHRSGQATPPLEWIVGGLGLVLVCSAIAFLVYHSLARDHTPPDIRVVAERVIDLGNDYLVQFRALNQGRSAAADVTIEGELVGSDGTTEVGEAVLDYLPPRSDREGGLLFTQDPRAGELRLRAKGVCQALILPAPGILTRQTARPLFDAGGQISSRAFGRTSIATSSRPMTSPWPCTARRVGRGFRPGALRSPSRLRT